MYSTLNEGKSLVAERFVRTLKNKIYKYITSRSKKVYINKLDNIVNKYSNRYLSTIKTRLVDVKSSSYIGFNKKNKEDPNFKVGDHVRISKYEDNFAKGYISNFSEVVFVITKVKNTVPWTYVINDRTIFGKFY